VHLVNTFENLCLHATNTLNNSSLLIVPLHTTHTHTHTHTHTRTRTRILLNVLLHARAYTIYSLFHCAHTYAHTQAKQSHTYTHTHIRTQHTLKDVQAHIYTRHTHIHTHTRAHTLTHTSHHDQKDKMWQVAPAYVYICACVCVNDKSAPS
jgi:hypothetical protein